MKRLAALAVLAIATAAIAVPAAGAVSWHSGATEQAVSWHS